MITLPAEAFDILQASAAKYGGMGWGLCYDGKRNPLCMLGHLEYAGYDGWRGFPIGTVENDQAIVAIQERTNLMRYERVPFADWCAELGVVRGA